jgi:Protein of unknown function (DUF3223)
MGKVRRIALDTRVFEKAGDATSFFSAMLNRYSEGAFVSDTDAKDLVALLKRHDERDEKMGPGIDHFEVDAAPDGYAGKCFWVIRRDGSRIDISYKHCLLPKPFD